MKTESWNEPQCMMKSTITKKGLNLIISGNDVKNKSFVNLYQIFKLYTSIGNNTIIILYIYEL